MSVPPMVMIARPMAIPIPGALREDVVPPIGRKTVAASGPSLREPVSQLAAAISECLRIIPADPVAARELIRAERSAAGV